MTISISQASPPYPSPRPVHHILLPGQSTISFTQASLPYPSPRPVHHIRLPGQSTISISQASPPYPSPRPVHHILLPGQASLSDILGRNCMDCLRSVPKRNVCTSGFICFGGFFVLFFNKSKCDTQKVMEKKGSIPDF